MPRPAVGDVMPHFSLPDQSGAVVRSESWLGQGPIVLYFYPRDETLGCTIEACGFRDRYPEFRECGAIVAGISPDAPDSHRRFAAKHHLPFTLLSDPEQKVFALYGVEDLLGLLPGRETFVMDREGIVCYRVAAHLQPRKHVREALAAVKRLRL